MNKAIIHDTTKTRIKLWNLRVVRERGPDYVAAREPALTPKAVFQVFSRLLEACDREEFWIMLMNSQHVPCGIHQVSVGSANASLVHPREVFKAAVLESAVGIVLIHNHPSGIPVPSREDETLTTRLSKCGDLIGIPVLDHIIIGTDRFTSLRETNPGLFVGGVGTW